LKTLNSSKPSATISSIRLVMESGSALSPERFQQLLPKIVGFPILWTAGMGDQARTCIPPQQSEGAKSSLQLVGKKEAIGHDLQILEDLRREVADAGVVLRFDADLEPVEIEVEGERCLGLQAIQCLVVLLVRGLLLELAGTQIQAAKPLLCQGGRPAEIR
jgi:hypothetical protein